MTSKARLLEMLNVENPAPFVFTESNVIVSTPVPSVSEGRNTKVTVSAVVGSGYSGSVDVHYTRPDLSELGYIGISSETPLTAEQILEKINLARAANIEQLDLEQITLPSTETGVVQDVAIAAVPNSYGWTGSTSVEVLLGIPSGANRLHTLLHQTLPAPGYL